MLSTSSTGGTEWRQIPGGPFTMGSDPAAEHVPDADEAPAHRVACAAFRLGRTPVTNAEYLVFVEATGAPAPSHWPDGVIPAGRERHPVTYVSWDDAQAFCGWAGGFLPSEAEWERAARGDDDRAWPWGDDAPTPDRAVFGTTDTAAVGLLPQGAGPCGALDLAGNAWEWTSSALRPYPYDARDGREDAASRETRVVRGGAFIHGPGQVRCSFRHGMLPGAVDHYVGFRLGAEPGAVPVLAVDLVDVPAGEVLLGNDPRPSAGPSAPDEAPQHTLDLPHFWLAATPVTNEQYRAFVLATGHPPPPHWPGGTMPAGLADHPVTFVDWHGANAFCLWAGGGVRLPREAEWEKGARGTDRRLYPWGDHEPDAAELVLNQHKVRAGAGASGGAADIVLNQHKVGVPANVGGGAKGGGTTPVGEFPGGASPYGLLDMAGNVWEWVSSAYAPYPYDAADGREDQGSGSPRVLRGGSYASPDCRNARCAARSRSAPGRRSPHIGFRVARFPDL